MPPFSKSGTGSFTGRRGTSTRSDPDLPDFRLWSYPVATVIAEKFEALVRLDMQNSRMKDFFDLDFLLGGNPPERGEIEAAIRATFVGRGTALPTDPPAGLSDEFVAERSVMWDAFLRKNGLEPRDFGRLVEGVRGKMAWLWTG